MYIFLGESYIRCPFLFGKKHNNKFLHLNKDGNIYLVVVKIVKWNNACITGFGFGDTLACKVKKVKKVSNFWWILFKPNYEEGS